ncbi:hypothetical protein ACOTCI_04795 [Achromobacter xylosoxidans]
MKNEIINLLSNKNRIQNELSLLKSSYKFDSQTILKRTSLLKELFQISSNLQHHTQEEISNALEHNKKIEQARQRLSAVQQKKAKKSDDWIADFLLWILLYIELKQEHKAFLMIAISIFSGDKNEYKNN